MVQHPLDLPSLAARPDPSVLLHLLKGLQRSTVYSPGAKSEPSGGLDTNPAFAKALFAWLTTLVSSPLAWIPTDAAKEEIWDLASVRMAERCGRTAAPKQIREICFPDFTVKLVEPSLTSDSLGLTTWGSSIVLAERLVKDHADCLVEPILELGAGTGLCGIVASKLGYNICVTDLPEIVDNLIVNVSTNSTNTDKGSVDVRVLDWLSPDSFDYRVQHFNSIVVSDPIYSEHHPKMVCDMIDRFLVRDSRSRLCVQLPLRPKFEAERDAFYTRIKNMGLVQLRYQEQKGYDDFGQQNYAWSLWTFAEN